MSAARDRIGAFATALDACHDAALPGGAVPSGTGWAVASAERLTGGGPLPGTHGRLAARRAGGPADPAAYGAFCGALLRLQWRTLAETLDDAVHRLGGRESEGGALLGRQLVRGAVADVALVLAESHDLLDLPGPGPARRHRVHRDLVAAGRTALRLHGAHGFTAEGPGPLLHLTELLGNTYLHPEAADD
ncbi:MULTISPECIES: hypothetical protein [unclassified Streptomyces]|uniref:hypothetical protein n=1 Tax=unclassified Streptomyces TaxID=2593676 RepID=UPI002238327C|nr:hypothetical protein [Streptomyces sp. SHP 1-2]MCW5253889.1 hypothetical protein [Streptomyces sp. SHP 1-2]